MNKKNIWCILPTILLPYMGLVVWALIMFSTQHPILKFIMEEVFQGDAFNIVALLVLACILASLLSFIYFLVGIFKNWDALSYAKWAMIVKLIQVPAYVVIYAVSFLLVFTIFTIPFSVGFFLLDCFAVFLTGLLTIGAVINSIRQGALTFKETFWIILLQFVFCADVAAAIILYKKLEKMEKESL